MSRKEWLENLQVGDEVAMEYGSYGRSKYKLGKIERITPTRQIVVGTTRFDSEGRERKADKGSFYSKKMTLYPLTDEIRDAIETDECLYIINAAKFATMDLKRLRLVRDAILKGEEP